MLFLPIKMKAFATCSFQEQLIYERYYWQNGKCIIRKGLSIV